MPDASDIAKVSERLVTVFAKIGAERMDGVPILNAKLAVEAIGTREWNGHWLSLLITPWFINLMLLPTTDEQRQAWGGLALGSSVPHGFPSGRFEFLLGEEPALGRYQMCSLFSPVLEFEDQEAARIAGCAALEALFDESLDAEDEARQEQVREPARKPRAISRRGLLAGKIASGGGSV